MFTARHIKNIRKTLGMDPDEFAAELGLTGKRRGKTVFWWEEGKYTPSRTRFAKLKELNLRAKAVLKEMVEDL